MLVAEGLLQTINGLVLLWLLSPWFFKWLIWFSGTLKCYWLNKLTQFQNLTSVQNPLICVKFLARQFSNHTFQWLFPVNFIISCWHQNILIGVMITYFSVADKINEIFIIFHICNLKFIFWMFKSLYAFDLDSILFCLVSKRGLMLMFVCSSSSL